MSNVIQFPGTEPEADFDINEMYDELVAPEHQVIRIRLDVPPPPPVPASAKATSFLLHFLIGAACTITILSALL